MCFGDKLQCHGFQEQALFMNRHSAQQLISVAHMSALALHCSAYLCVTPGCPLGHSRAVLPPKRSHRTVAPAFIARVFVLPHRAVRHSSCVLAKRRTAMLLLLLPLAPLWHARLHLRPCQHACALAGGSGNASSARLWLRCIASETFQVPRAGSCTTLKMPFSTTRVADWRRIASLLKVHHQSHWWPLNAMFANSSGQGAACGA